MVMKKIVFDSSFAVYDEWDWIENFPLKPEDFTIGSGEVVWWEHFGKDGQVHRWRATIRGRVGRLTRKGTNCPFCTGKQVGYGNDLATSYPWLAEQWHPTKNERGPESYLPGSNEKVWWVEEVEGIAYEWEAVIYSRALDGKGNPYLSGHAVGYGNDLATLRPDLAKQWHPTKNEKGPECYTPGSGEKVWWVEEVGGVIYEWEAVIENRTLNGNGNPYLSGQAVGYGNDLATLRPDLAKQWHLIKNEKGPECYTLGSNEKVWWVEEVSGIIYEWEATIASRALNNAGNPYLSGNKVGYGNDLATLRPDLAKQWHPTKNEKGPECYTPGSGEKVWWVEEVGGVIYEWEAIISNRTLNGHCNPYLSSRAVGYGNDLATLRPDLAKQWHPTKNEFGPEQYLPQSHKKVWWQHTIASGEVHEWEAAISSRVCKGAGCSQCPSGPMSKVANEWLDSLGIPNIYRETREFSINIGDKTFVVDGFDPITNTVYEFLGDLWHGNPEVFDQQGINPVSKEPFCQLYQETMSRLELIKQAGYNLVYIWEKDFRLNKKERQ